MGFDDVPRPTVHHQGRSFTCIVDRFCLSTDLLPVVNCLSMQQRVAGVLGR